MIKQILFGFCILFIHSCSDQPQAPHQQPQATGAVNFGVLKYDSSALEYRLDSIHNRGLILQPILRDAENNNNAFQLISYAYDTLNDYNNSWMPDTLAVVNDSLPKHFSGKIAVANNEVTREQLLNVVRDGEGKRFSYDYVLFTPVVEGVFYHVVYHLKAYKNGQPASLGARQMTSPMPPVRNWN